jgi:hypothetical protein
MPASYKGLLSVEGELFEILEAGKFVISAFLIKARKDFLHVQF